MQFDPKTVWLVSGNKMKPLENDQRTVTPEIVQRVVIAADVEDAYGTLASAENDFIPIGHATLFDFETIVEQIRNSLTPGQGGVNDKLPVLVSKAMAELQPRNS